MILPNTEIASIESSSLQIFSQLLHLVSEFPIGTSPGAPDSINSEFKDVWLK
jgi:hypothetical protein